MAAKEEVSTYKFIIKWQTTLQGHSAFFFKYPIEKIYYLVRLLKIYILKGRRIFIPAVYLCTVINSRWLYTVQRLIDSVGRLAL